MTRIPDAPYAGPQFRDTAVVTTKEVNAGQNPTPPGTVPHVVEPGDNLWDISGGNLEGIYRNNPQFDPENGSRNPDLIYPGEVVFVPVQPGTPEATNAAAQQLADARGMSASTDSQVTHKENQVADAGADLEYNVRAEIAAGGDPAAIKTRLANDPALESVPDAELNAIVDRATQPASAENPVGGARPYGIVVDSRGSVFVVDSGNTRVQQFMPAEEGSERLQEEAEAVAELGQVDKTTKV